MPAAAKPKNEKERLKSMKKAQLKIAIISALFFFAAPVFADHCENNVASAQVQGLESLLSRPQHKSTLNSTAIEARQNVNKGQVAIVSSETQQNLGHSTITNLCSADASEENFWECTYKKTVVKPAVLPSSEPFRHSKEVKYRIGNIREGTNSKCLVDFSITQTAEKHGSED